MVSFEEVNADSSEPQASASHERLLDAQEIEDLGAKVQRDSVRVHLESLAKKLRKESEALQRVEKSQVTATLDEHNNDEAMVDAAAVPAPVPVPAPVTPMRTPVAVTTPAATTRTYQTVDRFSFDAGGYNAPFVTVYVSLTGVGSIPRELITCEFAKSSFDLIVRDLRGKSYRLFKDSLEKDIKPNDSKILVKADKIIIKLAKIKSEYGSFDYWSKLVDNKKTAKKEKDDPQASIMKMMKDMYDEGDDNMKKMIGETMMKQQRGEKPDRDFGKGMDDMDF